MGGFFGGQSTPVVQPRPAPPKTEDPAVEKARRDEVIRASQMRGRAATLVTGGHGDRSKVPLRKAKLLSGVA